jgi:hypothetical protein
LRRRITTSRRGWLLAGAIVMAVVQPVHAEEAPSAAASAAGTVQLPSALVKDALDASLRQLPSTTPDQVAKAVTQACNQAMLALLRNDGQAVLDQLAPLARWQPLKFFPSYRVQVLQSEAYRLLGDNMLREQHAAHARLLSAIFQQGRTPEAPLRLVHLVQLGDLIMLGGGQVQDSRSQPVGNGGSLITLTFKDDPQGLKTRYLDTSALLVTSAMPPRYSVLMTPDMPADLHAALAENRAMLARFYADTAMDFMKLEDALRRAIEAADALIAQRKPAEALQALQAVAAVRALDEIPHVPFLMRLSLVHGDLGQRADQQRLRRQLFGLQQAIAATGDGLSFETAVEAPFIEMEYDWLGDRKLKRSKQSLVHRGDQSFDVMDVVDAQGNASQRYFNITRMWQLRAASLGRKP